MMRIEGLPALFFRFLIFTFHTVCLVLVNTSDCQAFEYELSGKLSVEKFNRSSKYGQKEAERLFTVAVRVDCWWIETIQSVPGQTDAKIEIGSTNGTTLVEVTHPSFLTNKESLKGYEKYGGKSNSLQEIIAAKQRMVNIARVYPRKIPVGCLDRLVSHIWMMWASHVFFRKNTDGLITPTYDFSAVPLKNKDF